MTTSRTLRAAATMLAVVTLLSACTPEDQPEPTPGPSPSATPSPDPMPTDDPSPSAEPSSSPPLAGSGVTPLPGVARVFIDGWSLRAVGSTAMKAQVDDATESLRFRSVTGEQLVELAGSHPEIVQTVLSRMVDAATTVVCSSEGCLLGGEALAGASAGGDVSCMREVCLDDWYRLDAEALASLADAPAVPGYGEVYESWGIPKLLYVADVDVRGASELVVRTRGVAEHALALAATLELEDGEGEPGAGAAAALSLGFGQDMHLVAAGLGRVFTPVVGWSEQEDIPYTLPMRPVGEASNADLEELGSLPLMGGVGTEQGAARLLSPEQLMYLTSPTTGCGVGLHCVPTADYAGDVEVAATTVVDVCRGDTRTRAVVTDATLTMDLDDRVIHQAGMWNGAAPSDFTRHTGGLFSGQAELVGDGTRMRVLLVQVADAGGALYEINGFAWQLGVDDPAFAEAPFDANAVVDATIWQRC